MSPLLYAFSLTLAKTGNIIADSTAMIAITVKSSMSVNARFFIFTVPVPLPYQDSTQANPILFRRFAFVSRIGRKSYYFKPRL